MRPADETPPNLLGEHSTCTPAPGICQEDTIAGMRDGQSPQPIPIPYSPSQRQKLSGAAIRTASGGLDILEALQI
jgi:hypothetical protein